MKCSCNGLMESTCALIYECKVSVMNIMWWTLIFAHHCIDCLKGREWNLRDLIHCNTFKEHFKRPLSLKKQYVHLDHDSFEKVKFK